MEPPGGLRRWCAAAVLCAGLAGASTNASAQSFPGISLSTPGPTSAAAIDALYTSAPIVLDGTTLFTIAVKAAQNDDQPIAVRANTVSVALDSLLATTNDGSTVYDPASLHVEIVRDGGATVLEAVDAHHRDGFPIVTVTTADAEYAQSSIDVLAENYQAVLQTALVRALTIRQPEIQRRNVTRLFAPPKSPPAARRPAGMTTTRQVVRRISTSSACCSATSIPRNASRSIARCDCSRSSWRC
jgi:hypothetical protein